jgi:hypothetical protein
MLRGEAGHQVLRPLEDEVPPQVGQADEIRDAASGMSPESIANRPVLLARHASSSASVWRLLPV